MRELVCVVLVIMAAKALVLCSSQMTTSGVEAEWKERNRLIQIEVQSNLDASVQKVDSALLVNAK